MRPVVEPEVLGRIILLQSTIHVMQDPPAMARFACRGLGTLPGVRNVCMCIKDGLFGDSPCFLPHGPDVENWCRRFGAELSDPADTQARLLDLCRLHAIECLKIETTFDLYGILFVTPSDAVEFGHLRPYVENTLNIIALILENNVQKAALLRHQARLEDLVEERTAELEKTVEQLQVEIQERQRYEAERVRLEDQLRQAQKMEAIGTLAGGIAHDFNNLLSIILGNTELALDEVQAGSLIQGNLNEARIGCLRARNLVRQILDFSRQTESQKEHVDVFEFLEDSLKLIRATIPTTVAIKRDFGAERAGILANPTQLSQVLINLCTNALQAMEQEGVLTISAQTVCMAATDMRLTPHLSPGRYVRLSVSDNGCGIEAEILDRIFDPYFTTKETGKGSGLGLAVVYGIVKSHNGGITVESTPGKGATFSIYLPAQDPPEPRRRLDPDTGQVSAAETAGQAARILFVDDEAMIVDIGVKLLTALGYQATGVQSPLQALDVFKAAPHEYDLIITDMTMPEMPGDRLAAEILKIRPQIPVILCTGHSDRVDEQHALEAGIRKFLMKPVTREKFAAAIREVLG